MPQDNGPAIDIGAIERQAEILDYGERLAGKSFVQFDAIDIIQGQARQFERLGIAYTGPTPISSGKQPASAKDDRRASERMPRAGARSSDMTTAAAPSQVCGELPAVTARELRRR